MNSSHAHSVFYKNFMNITLFMAQPIDFPRLEANRPSQWDNSSQGQANHPSGGAIHLSSAPSTVYPFLWPPVVMYPLYFVLEFFWGKLDCDIYKTIHVSLSFSYPFPFCAVSFGLFLVYDSILSMFSVFVWCCSISLSMWLIWLYLLVRYILLP